MPLVSLLIDELQLDEHYPLAAKHGSEGAIAVSGIC